MTAQLARMKAGPPALQPKSAMVSLRNQIRDLQRVVDDEAMLPTAASFSPILGEWVTVDAPKSSEAQGPPAPVAEEASVSIPEPPSPQSPRGDDQGPPAPGSEEASESIPEPPLSKHRADNLRRELRAGVTARGQPITDDQKRHHLARLRGRLTVLPPRYREAEMARIDDLEMRFVGHLAAAANSVKDHVDAALEPLLARAEGRLPPRRAGQTLSQRKAELDQVMIGLRHERSQLVAAEREEREAKRAEPPRKRARASKSTAPESGP